VSVGDVGDEEVGGAGLPLLGGDVRGQLGGLPGPPGDVVPPLDGGVDDVVPDPEPVPGLDVEPVPDELEPVLDFDFDAGGVSASGGPGFTGGGSGFSCAGGSGTDGRIGMVTPGWPDA
jgi:hypothetical protein